MCFDLQKGKAVYTDSISLISREGNKDEGGDDKIHVHKHKYDSDIIITPNNEVICI